MKIIGAILKNEVTRRVRPAHQPGLESKAARWGPQPGYVVFGGRKVGIERPRVRTRKSREVELDGYTRLQHDGRRQRAVTVVGLSDYVIKPKLVGDEDTPAILVYIALFGGVEVLGLAGLIMGPILMALAVAALRLYAREKQHVVGAVVREWVAQLSVV